VVTLHDFDLGQLIDHESRAETATALDRLLLSDRLAGRMGERIAAGNARFRGRAASRFGATTSTSYCGKQIFRIHACDLWLVRVPAGDRALWRRGRAERSGP